MELHAFLGVLGLEHCGNLIVHRAQNLWKHLYHGNLRANRIEKGCKLHPYNTTTYNNQFLRYFSELEEFTVGDNDGRFRNSRDGWHGGLRAGADKDAGGLVGIFIRLDGKTSWYGALYDGLRLYNFHGGFPHAHADAAYKFFNHLFLALHNGREIKACPLHGNAVFISVTGVIQEFCTVEKCFCGDATFI